MEAINLGDLIWHALYREAESKIAVVRGELCDRHERKCRAYVHKRLHQIADQIVQAYPAPEVTS